MILYFRYVNKDRKATEELIKKVHDLKQLKAFFVTVDAAAPGKREADERTRAEVEVASGISGGKIQSDKKGGGIGRSVGGFIDPKLCESGVMSIVEWPRLLSADVVSTSLQHGPTSNG